jgi:hypothetical protein
MYASSTLLQLSQPGHVNLAPAADLRISVSIGLHEKLAPVIFHVAAKSLFCYNCLVNGLDSSSAVNKLLKSSCFSKSGKLAFPIP